MTREDRVTAGDLIPTMLAYELVQLRGADDASAWRIGDIAAELVDEAAAGEKKTAIRLAVSDLAGVLPSTVRDYEASARFYPDTLRAQFAGVLTYSHYRVARKAGQLGVAQYWLEQAVLTADDYGGNPMPVRVLAAKMGNKKQALDPITAWRRFAAVWRPTVTADAPEFVDDVADDVRAACQLLARAADKLAAYLQDDVGVVSE